MIIVLWIFTVIYFSITGLVDTLSHRWIPCQHLKRKSIYISQLSLEQRRIRSLHASSVHDDKIATTSKNYYIIIRGIFRVEECQRLNLIV